MNNIPCRKAITEVLTHEAKSNPDLFVVANDSRGSVTLEDFAEQLPDQFVEVGIAEQNAVGIGTGMALSGKNVFVCGPACFLSARSLEQIKVDVAYAGSNVKILGVSGGVSYGALGSTHHSLHDIAVMRTFPGMSVFLPADRYQAAWLARHLIQTPGPAYVRVGRDAVPDIYSKQDVFETGKAVELRSGSDISLIAAGETVYHALQAAEILEIEGIKATVLDMHTLKPIDREAVIEAAHRTGHIITIEEHSIFGGLGAAVAEIIAQEAFARLKILGLPDEYAIHAKPLDLFDYYGLTAKNIASQARAIL